MPLYLFHTMLLFHFLKNLTPRLQFGSSSCVDAVKLSWLEITFHCYSFGEILTSKIGHTDLVFGV